MKRDEVINHLPSHRAELKHYGVTFLALFGSVARDEARDGSDLDVLVEFEGRITFDRYYVDFKFYLEDLLRVSVDWVTKKMLRSEIRETVEREAIRVA